MAAMMMGGGGGGIAQSAGSIAGSIERAWTGMKPAERAAAVLIPTGAIVGGAYLLYRFIKPRWADLKRRAKAWFNNLLCKIPGSKMLGLCKVTTPEGVPVTPTPTPTPIPIPIQPIRPPISIPDRPISSGTQTIQTAATTAASTVNTWATNTMETVNNWVGNISDGWNNIWG